MNKLISYTLIALFATLALAIAAPENDQAMTREKAAWQTYKEKKEADFRKMIADNYRGVYADAICNVAEEMKAMQQIDIKSFALSDLNVISTDPDTQIVTYKVNFQYSMGGKDDGGDHNACSVWQKQNADWKVIFHTNVKVEKP
ncbi:MAG: nuclear transport factor 2 family protein [Betaproteobacteria bacterium]|nr:nuclear transport factor 2 family protein [Chthoniobacterales bacterium]MBA3776884.1 nuclear transport factor 2 family protein [Betaproteobacteria bacterium]